MKKKILAIIISALILSSTVTVLGGCGCSRTDTATPDETTTTVQTHTTDNENATEPETLSAADKAIADSGLKVDDKGNVTDSKGNTIKKTSDGKIEVKTADGKTVKVDANDIKSVNNSSKQNNDNKGSSSGNGSADKKTNNDNLSVNVNSSNSKSKTDNKNSSSSSSVQASNKPASNSNTQTDKKTASQNQNSSGKQESPIVTETRHTHTWVDITEQIKVIDKEAYTYETPLYETTQIMVCSEATCYADLSSLSQKEISAHMKNHALKGENAGWHSDTKNVQVGTKTVTVPEESHYETKTTGRKCSSCGKTE